MEIKIKQEEKTKKKDKFLLSFSIQYNSSVKFDKYIDTIKTSQLEKQSFSIENNDDFNKFKY